MSPTKSRGVIVTRWVVGLLSLGFAVWLWLNHQYVIDLVHYYQYQPTASVKAVAAQAKLADQGKFLFYASKPEVADSAKFNNSCERKEADSPILGCYAAGQIFIFDVTNKQLDGIKAVTAAHEMLHAAYDRLSDGEKDRLKPLLEQAYQRVKTSELEKRMAYYNKNEPGESINELHSILGTEFTNLGGDLERYYSNYFENRAALVTLHSSVQSVFEGLSRKADQLLASANSLADAINRETKQYNADVTELNKDIQSFNATAQRPGGFGSEAEFDAARASLVARSNALDSERSRIKAEIEEYKSLVAQLEAVNTETAQLNRSIDSTLSTTPTL